MTDYVAKLTFDDLSVESRLLTLAQLNEPNCKIGFHKPYAYVRAHDPADKELSRLRSLGSDGVYVVEEEHLRREDERLWSETLPDLNWQNVDELIEYFLPVKFVDAAVNGVEPSAVDLQVISDETLRIGNGSIPIASYLLTSMERWSEFALSCPEVRLKQLRFAVNRNSQAIIHGTPLPTIEGQYFYSSGRVVCQLATAWKPRVSTEVLAELFDLQPSQLLLIQQGEQPVVIDEAAFVGATRMAVRTSYRSLKAVGPYNANTAVRKRRKELLERDRRPIA